MKLEVFKQFAATNEWVYLWPEMALAGLAILLLVLDLFAPTLREKVIPRVAIFGHLVILGLVLGLGSAVNDGGELFGTMIVQSEVSHYMRVFFLLTGALVCFIASVYFTRQNFAKSEYYHVAAIVTAGMMLLGQSNHFVMLFVALETVTIGFYILVAYSRTSPQSLEGGLKYLVMGGLSSSLLLFGIVLLYGAAGNPELTGGRYVDGMNFGELTAFIAAHPDNLYVKIGALLVLSGIFFKVGAVPFQIWIPDVYQGAPTPTTAFLAVGSKAAGYVILLNLVVGPFAPISGFLLPVMSAVAAVTILFGNITALTQRNVKRLMGLSGVAHAGYLLVGIIAVMLGSQMAQTAVLFYLFTYLFGSFAVFGVMAHVAPRQDDDQELDHYANLVVDHPLLAYVLAIGLGSLAGIPPLAGFIGKLLIFLGAFSAGLYALLAVSIVGVVLSIYYYFGWVREAFFKVTNVPGDEASAAPAPREVLPVSLGNRVTLIALAVITVVLGVYQGGIFS